jgi:hypothetical protein
VVEIGVREVLLICLMHAPRPLQADRCRDGIASAPGKQPFLASQLLHRLG